MSYEPNSGPYSGWTSQENHLALQHAIEVNSTGAFFNDRQQQWEYWVVSGKLKVRVSWIRTNVVFYGHPSAYDRWLRTSEQTAKYILGTFHFAISAAADTLLNWLNNERSHLPNYWTSDFPGSPWAYRPRYGVVHTVGDGTQA